jgi:hypothetical protein
MYYYKYMYTLEGLHVFKQQIYQLVYEINGF